MYTKLRQRCLPAFVAIAVFGGVGFTAAKAAPLEQFRRSQPEHVGVVKSDHSHPASSPATANQGSRKAFVPAARNSAVGTESGKAGHPFNTIPQAPTQQKYQRKIDHYPCYQRRPPHQHYRQQGENRRVY